MIESSSGIILRVRPLTETSLIAHWLTPDFGRIATVARGARRPNSPFRGKLDLYYHCDFSFARSRRSELHTLREVALRETRAVLRREISRLQQAAYCVALIEQTTETDTPLPAIFHLLIDLLDQISQEPPRPQTLFAFELRLLNELGLKPDLAKSNLTPGGKRIVNALLRGDWAATSRLKLSEAQVMELRRFLHGFMVFHLGKIPKGRTSGLDSPTASAANARMEDPEI